MRTFVVLRVSLFFLNPGLSGYCTSEQVFSAAVKVGNLTQHSVGNNTSVLQLHCCCL